jgi:hypothetical protein
VSVVSQANDKSLDCSIGNQECATTAAIGRHGVFWETCANVNPTTNTSYFVFWDGQNYFLFAKSGYAIDPSGQGAEFLQYDDAVTCNDRICGGTDHYLPFVGAPDLAPVSWEARAFDAHMEVFKFFAPGETASCASFRVTGQDCHSVVSALQQFATQQGLTFHNLHLNHAHCN